MLPSGDRGVMLAKRFRSRHSRGTDKRDLGRGHEKLTGRSVNKAATYLSTVPRGSVTSPSESKTITEPNGSVVQSGGA